MIYTLMINENNKSRYYKYNELKELKIYLKFLKDKYINISRIKIFVRIGNSKKVLTNYNKIIQLSEV